VRSDGQHERSFANCVPLPCPLGGVDDVSGKGERRPEGRPAGVANGCPLPLTMSMISTACSAAHDW
jgi:hypothetical protein